MPKIGDDLQTFCRAYHEYLGGHRESAPSIEDLQDSDRGTAERWLKARGVAVSSEVRAQLKDDARARQAQLMAPLTKVEAVLLAYAVCTGAMRCRRKSNAALGLLRKGFAVEVSTHVGQWFSDPSDLSGGPLLEDDMVIEALPLGRRRVLGGDGR